MIIIDLTGKQFGRLTVIARAGSKDGHKLWRCICSCGNEKLSKTADLRHNGVASCGCLVMDTNRAIRLGKPNPSTTTHGATSGGGWTPEYISWLSMRQRCSDKNHNQYKNYGGRGISVCDQWKSSFECFLRDMGLKPSKGHSIDRIDPNGDYNPWNCRWADRITQQNNRTNNRCHTVLGQRKTATQLAKELNIHVHTMFNRLDKFDAGLITEQQLLKPLLGQKNIRNITLQGN